MVTTLFWGAIFRMIETTAQAAPSLLCGLLLAGVFRQLLGPTNTRRLFGSNTWRSLPQAWGLGMLLPVCSLGVIPMLRELRRAGVSGGVILAFALAAPLFNPLSLLYGLTLSSPVVILSFAFGSLVVISILGIVWDRMLPATPESDLAQPPVAPGLKRWLAVLVTAARHSANATMIYCGIGIAGAGILAASLPRGCLQSSLNHSNPWAPLVMAIVAPLVYVTPTNVMMQLGSMFNHGNSVGAAFALLTIGAGVNTGLIAWTWRSYGSRAMLTWFLTLELVVLGIGYAVEKPLYLEGQAEANHTHVFDSFTSPFTSDSYGLPPYAIAMLNEKVSIDQRAAVAVLMVLVIAGIALKRFDSEQRVEQWLRRDRISVSSSNGLMNRPLPAPVLGGVALLIAIALSVVACYIIYPDAHEVFEDMRIVRADALCAVNCNDRKQAERQLHIWDDLARKLEIGTYLREWRLTPAQQDTAKTLRQLLSQLDDVVDGKDHANHKDVVASVNRAYEECRSAFQKTNGKPIR
jgi:uncharacterized membrane protein YraQ (UPF0718 family)